MPKCLCDLEDSRQHVARQGYLSAAEDFCDDRNTNRKCLTLCLAPRKFSSSLSQLFTLLSYLTVKCHDSKRGHKESQNSPKCQGHSFKTSKCHFLIYSATVALVGSGLLTEHVWEATSFICSSFSGYYKYLKKKKKNLEPWR